jgi:pimeloyl-ACP methyl ester carboxylesterase
MKHFYCLLLLLLSVAARAQDVTGQWNGLLKASGVELRLVFHVTKTEAGYTATMDSPDQGATGVPMTSATFLNNELKLTQETALIEYTGVLRDTLITGTYKQGALSIPLNLSRTPIEKKRKPQEPVSPYPYYTEEVRFANAEAKVSLAGTLSLPDTKGVYPAVVLITGSGPQNRDEEMLGHKPFLVLADYLTRQGIAVLRYDDRGVGRSTGSFARATTQDFATDVAAAIAYLKTRREINQSRIGLIGHSEGGVIAPMVAADNKDVRFIVLMAGTGVRGDELLLAQQAAIGKASGLSDAVVETNRRANKILFDMITAGDGDTSGLRARLTAGLQDSLNQLPAADKPKAGEEQVYIQKQLKELMRPWMRYFIRYNPGPALEKVTCPVLAINGSKDLQVPATENLTAIRNALDRGGNRNVTIQQFPGLNHLFQPAETGLPAEYAVSEQTLSPDVLKAIANWIILTTGR